MDRTTTWGDLVLAIVGAIMAMLVLGMAVWLAVGANGGRGLPRAQYPERAQHGPIWMP